MRVKRFYAVIEVEIGSDDVDVSTEGIATCLSVLLTESNAEEPDGPYTWNEDPVVYDSLEDLTAEHCADCGGYTGMDMEHICK